MRLPWEGGGGHSADMSNDASPGSTEAPSLPPSLLALLALGAGLSAASLYYNQPILDAIAHDLGASTRSVGFVPMATQLGYAAGILFFSPLGDRLEKRRVILVKGTLLTLALVLSGFARSVEMLVATSLLVGLFATTAQDYVPVAAALAPASARGKTVGMVMTGLLLGILTSRLASGVVGDRFGWRVVYFGAAGTIAALTTTAAIRLPTLLPTSSASYGALLRSVVGLVREYAPLRRAALAQALLSMAFSGFWSTLALVLAKPPYELGSSVAGAFGIAGAFGAMAAPLAGAIADKRGPSRVIQAGALLVVLSFAAMAFAPGSLVVLVAATVVFDLGVHACLISHQSIVYGLAPEARSRLNAVLVSSMFLGMSAGAAIASRLLASFGFSGVAVFGATVAALALLVRLVPEKGAKVEPVATPAE